MGPFLLVSTLDAGLSLRLVSEGLLGSRFSAEGWSPKASATSLERNPLASFMKLRRNGSGHSCLRSISRLIGRMT